MGIAGRTARTGRGTRATCLAREIAEELGIEVGGGAILNSWVYEVLPQREVLIVTYGVRRAGPGRNASQRRAPAVGAVCAR